MVNQTPHKIDINKYLENAEEAQDILVKFAADATYHYLVEYTIEQTLLMPNNKNILIDDIFEKLEKNGIKVENRIINKDIILPQINDKKSIQDFTKELFDNNNIKPLSKIVDSSKYTKEISNYTKIFDDFEQKLKGKYSSCSDELKAIYDEYLSDLHLFRDGICPFPPLPEDLKDKDIPACTIKAIPEHPLIAKLNNINKQIIDTDKENYGEPEILRKNYQIIDRENIATVKEAGVKNRDRFIEKLNNDYNGNLSFVKDAARVKILVDDIHTLNRVNEIKDEMIGKDDSIDNITDKNKQTIRMRETSVWDLRNIFSIKTKDRMNYFPCEFRIEDMQVEKVNRSTHKIYNLIRKYECNGSEQSLSSMINNTNQLLEEISQEKIYNGNSNLKNKIEDLKESLYSANGDSKTHNSDIKEEIIKKLIGIHLEISITASRSRINGGFSHPTMSAIFNILGNDISNINDHNLFPKENGDNFKDEDLEIAQKIKDIVSPTPKQSLELK